MPSTAKSTLLAVPATVTDQAIAPETVERSPGVTVSKLMTGFVEPLPVRVVVVEESVLRAFAEETPILAAPASAARKADIRATRGRSAITMRVRAIAATHRATGQLTFQFGWSLDLCLLRRIDP